MCDPALVFITELSLACDARHPEDDRRDIVDACVVADVLVCGTFGASVGGVEIELLGLVDPVRRRLVGITRPPHADLTVRHVSIHFVGRGEEHERTASALANALENVEGANHVCFKIVTRMLQ